MTTLIIEHEVKDYATWRTGFDAHADVRNRFGLGTGRVYTDPNNTNLVCFIGDASAEQVHGFLNEPELQTRMAEAGVIGEPRILILEASRATTSALA